MVENAPGAGNKRPEHPWRTAFYPRQAVNVYEPQWSGGGALCSNDATRRAGCLGDVRRHQFTGGSGALGLWCMNRLDPSGELRVGFGEACEVAADKSWISHGIIGLRENRYPLAPFRSAGRRRVWAGFEVRLTIHATKPL